MQQCVAIHLTVLKKIVVARRALPLEVYAIMWYSNKNSETKKLIHYEEL